MDGVTKKERSRNMAAVKAIGNKSTEMVMVKLLRTNKLTGWRRHYGVTGKPDFAFPKKKVALFVDGCFWHGCPKYNSRPKTNKKFWDKKIEGNIKRDVFVNKRLRESGWKVLRVWEHEIKKDPEKVVKKLKKHCT